MGPPAIELERVSIRYRRPQDRIRSFKEYAIRALQRDVRHDDFWALRDASLTVEAGEVFGLVGPNGAGKSTLLKAVARVLQPSLGRVRVRGTVAPLIEVTAGIDFELTGRENILLSGATFGRPLTQIRGQVERIIDFAELREAIDAPVRTYSSGMVARLGFAVATAIRPDILLVDEVLAVGDDRFRAKSSDRINEFRAQGTTILLVSHNLDSIRRMCSRAAWLARGEIVRVGPVGEVAEAYEHRAA